VNAASNIAGCRCPHRIPAEGIDFLHAPLVSLPRIADVKAMHFFITGFLQGLNSPAGTMSPEHFRSSWRIDMNTGKMKHLLFLSIVATACAGAITTVHASGQTTGMQQQESVQPGSDTWITTKVKADLLATKDISGLEIKVETVNGVVTLSGDVDSQAEADKAVAVTQGIKGVSRVDNRLVVRGNR